MFRLAQPLLDRHGVVVDAPGPGEWIVRASSGGRRLHVFQVAPDDWLVSEVGLGSEGRGTDVARALAALAENGRPHDWWRLVPAALEDATRR